MKNRGKKEKQTQNYARNGTKLKDNTTTLIQKNMQSERENGEKITTTIIEKPGTPGTKELSTPKEESSSLVVSNTDRSMGLREHLASLRTAQSGSMNLLDSTTQHLHGLMMSVAEEAKNSRDDVRAWARDNTLVIRQTVDLARELTKSMRLKLDTVKALHKISKDIGDE